MYEAYQEKKRIAEMEARSGNKRVVDHFSMREDGDTLADIFGEEE